MCDIYIIFPIDSPVIVDLRLRKSILIFRKSNLLVNFPQRV